MKRERPEPIPVDPSAFVPLDLERPEYNDEVDRTEEDLVAEYERAGAELAE